MIVMCKADYIVKLNNVYANLEEYINVFEKEALVISEAKCQLLLNKKIDSFVVDGIYVESDFYSDKCYLYFNEYQIILYIVNDMIVHYDFVM